MRCSDGAVPNTLLFVRKGPRIIRSRLGSLISLTLLLAALVVSSTLADAQSPRPDARPHLLVVPHSSEGIAALDRSDARVVARYDDFTLVEAAGGDEAGLRDAGADRRDDMREVSLPAAELDPRADRSSLAAKRAPDRDETLALAQFIGPVKDAWLERLERTGARAVQYTAQNGYLVHADGAEVDRLAGLVGTDTAVRAVIPVAAEDKLDDGLTRAGQRTMAVQTVAGEAGAPARRATAAAGRAVRAQSSVAGLRTQFVRIDGVGAAALAEDPGVVSITPWSPPRLLDERAAQIVAGNLLPSGAPSGPGYLGWLASEGFPASTFPDTIDVTDTGLDNGIDPPQHPDFYENGMPVTDRVDYAFDYTPDGGANPARDCRGHGTNVASIAAGFGTAVDGEGFSHGLGVAPRAQLGASKIFTCTGLFGLSGAFAPVVSAAHAAGARISNNSWASADFLGEYGVDAQEFDALVRDAEPDVDGNQAMVEIFAAGNYGDNNLGSKNEGYGSVGSPATAKNVITVGASESVRAIGGEDGCGVSDAEADNPDDILDFSSRGPTDDGRLKPDVVAPGTHVTGARPQHLDYTGAGVCVPLFAGVYSLASGTSQAAPEVAGAASLIRDWYRREHGGGSVAPSPAMTKAILANTATDMSGGDNGRAATIEGAPNTDQGWGRVNMGEVLGPTSRGFVDQVDVLSNTGISEARTYRVADTNRPVKVTLAWTDAPGMVGGNAFVNDLDLVVEAGGRTYHGNVLSGGLSRPGGSADRRNNLESVFLPVGLNGRLAVRVVGTNIAGDGVPENPDDTDQDFALVVSNVEEASSPVLVHESMSIDDSSSAGGDADQVLEPGERFGLTERLRNAGDAGAGGVSGTLSGEGATFSPSSSVWGDVPAGAIATGAPPFAGELSPDVACGAEVSTTLDLATDQGPQSVPLLLSTGEPQSPTVATRNHSPPLPIPDDSAAGVTSPIQVTSPGRIKDLNVRINQIAHTFVGDLRVDVTGPDGTTVKLAEHPGGPDNGGDNFAGTVFDDEAGANISDGAPPYTGTFRPQNDQLSRFDGKPREGTWTLRVRDLVEGNAGTLSGWGTETQAAGCDFGGTDGPIIPPDPSGDDTTAPDFALARREEHLTDALKQGATVLAGCASACKLSAKLTIPAARARRLGLGPPGRRASPSARAVLAMRAVRLRAGENRAVRLPLSRAAKAALRDERSVKATLDLKLSASGRTVTLRRVAITLSRAARLRRVVRRGLVFVGACSEACDLRGGLLLSAREARRLGLRVRTGQMLKVAGGELRASSSPSRLVLRIGGRYRRALLRARPGVRATLETVVRGATGPERRLSRRLTLHR
jgi:subtilisin-like proprotein convertase family protein